VDEAPAIQSLDQHPLDKDVKESWFRGILVSTTPNKGEYV